MPGSAIRVIVRLTYHPINRRILHPLDLEKKQNPMLLEEGDSHRLAYSSFSSPVASSSSAYVSAYGDAVLYLDSVLDP